MASLLPGEESKKKQEFIFNSKNCLEALVELAASGVELPCVKMKNLVVAGKSKLVP